jgi:hypothetical protein
VAPAHRAGRHRNYPEEAKRHKIYGSLLMTVYIKADGSVESRDRPFIWTSPARHGGQARG